MNELKPRILIVEDEKIIGLDIKKTIERIGYEVVNIVKSGEAAIDLTGELKPDLVLMDIMLSGGISGIEAAEAIRRKFDIPVIYITGLTDEETFHKAKITEPFGYLVKPFDQKGLHSAIEMGLYKHKIESLLKLKTLELEEEKKKTDKLLLNILPAAIVRELKKNGSIAPRLFEAITIMFCNFHDFSGLIQKHEPVKVVGQLNEIYHKFDVFVENAGLEKMKTIGDTYMIGGGLPKESDDHALKIIEVAFKMLEYMNKLNLKQLPEWKLRIGVNSGQVVAGIVGTHKFTYDVWGDTVNIASRMENSCEPGKINITRNTYDLVKDVYDCEYRGKLNAKGMGEIDMFFVNGLK
ncbi:MAG: adenylate/guanylate cyclase domain-containing protein [Ignavibacteriaceae bacterium]|nr:adenylate/guanylate cyclase domain-containing protein [Ignavibacteriaceae bacterium]